MNDQVVVISAAAVVFLNLVMMVGGVVVFWRKGGNAASTEAITTYKAAVDAYEVRLKQIQDENVSLQKEIVLIREQHRTENEALRKEIDNLRVIMQEQERKYQAILIEKDKQIAGITTILQNRNPETEAMNKAALEFMRDKGQQIDEIYQKVVT